MRVLVADGDRKFTCELKRDLCLTGYEVAVVYNGDSVRSELDEQHYDAMIVDSRLPGTDGYEIVGNLRERKSDLPVMIMAADCCYEDRVRALQCGADDVMEKPYGFEELLLRLRNIINRRRRSGVQKLKLEDVSIDLQQQEVSRAGDGIRLRPLEFKLLTTLALARGQVVTRTQLLEKVWGYNFEPGTNLVRVAVARLREQIDRDRDMPLIETVYGVGYRIRSSEPMMATA